MMAPIPPRIPEMTRSCRKGSTPALSIMMPMFWETHCMKPSLMKSTAMVPTV